MVHRRTRPITIDSQHHMEYSNCLNECNLFRKCLGKLRSLLARLSVYLPVHPMPPSSSTWSRHLRVLHYPSTRYLCEVLTPAHLSTLSIPNRHGHPPWRMSCCCCCRCWLSWSRGWTVLLTTLPTRPCWTALGSRRRWRNRASTALRWTRTSSVYTPRILPQEESRLL